MTLIAEKSSVAILQHLRLERKNPLWDRNIPRLLGHNTTPVRWGSEMVLLNPCADPILGHVETQNKP
jgi:hypothetical protein